MSKITAKDFRKVKEITLPQSGITVNCFSSILVGDLKELGADQNKSEFNIGVILRVIKDWNFYDKEEDEAPLPINMENVSRLPAPDFQYLVEELEKFANEQKKS